MGKLIRVWIWADQQTTDGSIKISNAVIDRIASFQGFGKCLREAGWLTDSGFTNFLRHNGTPAKSRASTAMRVASHRAKPTECNAPVTKSGYKRVSIPRAMKREILSRDGNTCVYCRRPAGKYAVGIEMPRDAVIHLDHVIPLAQGGDDSFTNLVCACGVCNSKKNNRNPDQCGFEWPVNPVTKTRYGSVTKTLPEKRREECLTTDGETRKPEHIIPKKLDDPECHAAADKWFAFLESKGLEDKNPAGNEIALEEWWRQMAKFSREDFLDAVSESIAAGRWSVKKDRTNGSSKPSATWPEDLIRICTTCKQYPQDIQARKTQLGPKLHEVSRRLDIATILDATDEWKMKTLNQRFKQILKDIEATP